MVENDPAKGGIQELVQGFAAGLGIEPTSILFKWGQARPATPDDRVAAGQKVLDLKVYLGKASTVLSFSEELVESSANDAFAFVMKYTDYVIDALRRLKRPDDGDALGAS